MLKIKNIFIGSSLLLCLVNLSYFVYGFHSIHQLSETIKSDCRTYFHYNIGVLSLFAFSLIVFSGYLFCSTFTSHIMYILNAIGLSTMAIHRYVKKDSICDYKCEMSCGDLVKLGDNLEIFFISDLAIISLTVLVILCVFIAKVLRCCDYSDDY